MSFNQANVMASDSSDHRATSVQPAESAPPTPPPSDLAALSSQPTRTNTAGQPSTTPSTCNIPTPPASPSLPGSQPEHARHQTATTTDPTSSEGKIDPSKGKLCQVNNSPSPSPSPGSPHKSLRPLTSRKPISHSPSKTSTSPLPPPIVIPHLLLDRSRLKPVPKPPPAPLQPPATFSHLILPLRAKLRSTSNPNLSQITNTPSDASASSRSVSDSLVKSKDVESCLTSRAEIPDSDVPPPSLSATSITSSINDISTTPGLTESATSIAPDPVNPPSTPINPDKMMHSADDTPIIPPPAQEEGCKHHIDGSAAPDSRDQSDTLSSDTAPMMKIQADSTALPSSRPPSPPQSIGNHQSPSPPSSPSLPDHTSVHIDSSPSQPQQDENNDEDQIPLPKNHVDASDTPLPLDHSSTLERSNSAAARLDSLARLNGVKISSSFDPVHHHLIDVLPPFLIAKHIEETQKKAEFAQITAEQSLASPSFPLAPYPLALPASLGFGVGPNGRGVPRLSALQRKALEKMAASQQDVEEISTAATSLTRSHTTTGAESRKLLLLNRIQSPTSDESHERQQARSNLIRKLSSRGPNSRLKLPIQSTTPAGNPDDSLPHHHHPLDPTPEDQLVHSTESSHSSPNLELNQLALASPPCLPDPTNSTGVPDPNPGHPFPSTFVSSIKFQSTAQSTLPSDRTQVNNHSSIMSMTPVGADISQTCVIRDSLDSGQSPIDTKHLVKRVSIDHGQVPNSPDGWDSQPRHPTSRGSIQPVESTAASDSNSAQSEGSTLLPSSSTPSPQSHFVPRSSRAVVLDASPKLDSSINGPDYSALVAGASTVATITSSNSVRSSIVSRLKGRNSLSSRIDRSLASARSPSPSHSQSRQSSVDYGNEANADRRRSAINANRLSSRQSNPTNVQRIRTVTHESSQDRTSRSSHGINRGGSTSPSASKSSILYNGDRPMRPTRPPPITQAHSVLGRGVLPPKTIPEPSGPSQFPPQPHLARSHMPAASAADLARYNDQKLAPFPALLNSSPPSSPERPKSPRFKISKSPNHGLLAKSSNFFRSPSRRSQDGSLTSGVNSAQIGASKSTDPALLSNYPMRVCRSSEDEEEVVDSTRWQSMGDAAEKISASAELSRSRTSQSNNHSVMSIISSQRREQILSRLSPFLRLSNSITSPHTKLNEPPRRLLWHRAVLQVVNATCVKDRYLFLFNDLLVITKPIVEFEHHGGERVPKLPITLKHSFLGKSVVEIRQLRCVDPKLPVRPCHLQDDHYVDGFLEASNDSPQHRFKEMFQGHPARAVQDYLGGIETEDAASEVVKLLASIIGLDKRQLGQYLSGPTESEVLKKYLDQLNFGSMRIEDALRSALLSLRLPADPQAIVRFLETFGASWATSNPKIGISAELVTRWATAMILLSEHLHDGLMDSMRYVAGLIGFPNGIKAEADFVLTVKSYFDGMQNGSSPVTSGKSNNTLSAEKLQSMLKKSYQSIRRDRLVQARANVEDVEKIQIMVEEGQAKGLKLPPQVFYQSHSEKITITIPEPDPQFGIKLFGSGLSFEPSFLSFAQSPSASFQIKGRSLGMRQVSFIKIGRRAAAYDGLPLNATVSVERAFMRHTVQVGFLNHLNAKRNYLFSFQGSEAKTEFLDLVTKTQSEVQSKQVASESSLGPQAVGKIAALHVLRDTLILNEDRISLNVNPYVSTIVGLKVGNRTHKSAKPKSSDGVEKSEAQKTTKVRSNSLSETYIYTMGEFEKDLHQAIITRMNQAQAIHLRRHQHQLLQEQLRSNLEGGRMALSPYSYSNKENPVGDADENENVHLLAKYVKTGDELVKHCEQNSLIPLVLGFLSLGVDKVESSHINEGATGNCHSHNNSHSLANGQYDMNDSSSHNRIGGSKKQITSHSQYHYLQHHHQQLPAKIGK